MVRVAFTREGWYCLFVIVFVLGGAALREVNLLIVLAGLMIGPLVFHWRMVTLMLRKVEVTRSASERVRAGDVLTASVVVRNGRLFLDSWAIVVHDTIVMVGGSREDRATVAVLVPHVPPQSDEKGIYQATLTRRGRYLLGPLLLTTRFPLGLIAARQRVDCPGHVIVCPRTGRLTSSWRHLLESDRLGAEQTRARKGMTEDGEFFGLREWRPGDAQRLVHWRTSAKLGMLAVRQFEQQQHPDVTLLLDLYHAEGESPNDDEDVRLAIETAVSFAATVVDEVAQTGHVRLRFAVAGATPHCWSGVASPLMAEEVLDCLAEAQPGDGQQLEVALDEILDHQSRDPKLVVVSTRPQPSVVDGFLRDFHSRASLSWLNVRAGEHRGYFELVDESPAQTLDADLLLDAALATPDQLEKRGAAGVGSNGNGARPTGGNR